MTSAVYTVEIDIDRDSAYGHARSDLTPYVRALSWNNGMGKGDQEVAAPARLTVSLDNSSGAFDPSRTSALYYGLLNKGTLVRVRATYSSSTYTLFVGKITGISAAAGAYAHEASLQITDLLNDLLDAEYVPPLQTNVTTGAVLGALFDRGIIALAYTTDYWILGQAGYSELGTSTILLGGSSMIAFDPGQTTLAYAGDNAGTEHGISALGYVRDIVAAECGGRFFFNSRTGLFTFHGRHYNVNYTPAFTLTAADIDGVTYQAQEDIVNSINVSFQPRSVGTADSIVWSLDAPIKLGPDSTKTFTARYRHPDNQSAHVGVINPLVPTLGTDYQGFIDLTLIDISRDLIVTVNWGGSSAQVQLTNANAHYTMSVRKLTLRGTPITSYAKQTAAVFDVDSYIAYGIHEKNVTLRALDDEVLATDYANNIIAQFRNGVARAETLTVNANKSDARMTLAMSCAPGTVVTVDDGESEHNADYVIVGEAHRVRAGGEHTHDVTLTLKPLARAQYWVLGRVGFSELGTTTILAF